MKKEYVSKLLYKSKHNAKQNKTKQQEKSRHCELYRIQREQRGATATEFMRFTFLRNSQLIDMVRVTEGKIT